MNVCVCTSFTLFHMLSKTSTPSCTFFKTLSISPCNFLDAPIISKMSSVIGWLGTRRRRRRRRRDQIKSGRAHTLSHQIHSHSFIFRANLVDDDFIFASFVLFWCCGWENELLSQKIVICSLGSSCKKIQKSFFFAFIYLFIYLFDTTNSEFDMSF